MGTTKLIIGKIPISKGEYQEGTAYQRLNQVTMLGSTYQSKIDDNTSAPAQMGADGAVENINTDKWLCIAVGNVSAAKKVVYNNETSGLEAGNVQEAIDETNTKVSDLSEKTKEISHEDIQDDDDCIEFVSESGETVGKIDNNGADFTSLKKNGVEVLTSHQDVSGLATKEEVDKKQDKIEEITTDNQADDSEEIEFKSNDDKRTYAKINNNGVYAKEFYYLNGNPINSS